MGLLEDRVALVTGGTSGIGRASAILLARERARVALTGRRAAEGEAIVAEIKAAGASSAVFIEADLVTTGSIPAAMARAVASYGRLDLAFNNAGSSAAAKPDGHQAMAAQRPDHAASEESVEPCQCKIGQKQTESSMS